MKKYYLFIQLFLIGYGLLAQNGISGYIDIENDESVTEIHLSQIALENISDTNKAKYITSTSIGENGFFRFKKSLISKKEAIYRLHVTRFEKALRDTLQVGQVFLLSNQDSIQFKKSKIPFGTYTNSSLADKEWQKLVRFERQLRNTDFKREDSLSEAYIGNLKTYTKDSLEILMVKLISIKQLDNKDLLEKDIAKNPDYYVALLTELKESDIERSEYLFLENKLAFLTTEAAENKYATSKIIIVLLSLLVASLLFFVFHLRQRKTRQAIADLSKQEKNIQGLILQGKSNKEIANELFISLSTVKTHITNIYSKLRVSSRQELLQKIQNS
ncbi:helix-turn-helix transcriptional regulator [Maribacter sp. 2308TA10-17]|uniref:helix-turn-helix transcriptional regulator n=1 Tax=Maribacter sp. 2308TA10-17 TaxID=3386276 RepID=UPI0039BD9136